VEIQTGVGTILMPELGKTKTQMERLARNEAEAQRLSNGRSSSSGLGLAGVCLSELEKKMMQLEQLSNAAEARRLDEHLDRGGVSFPTRPELAKSVSFRTG